MKKYLKKAFSDSFLICLFTSSSFFLIGPITLFVNNYSEFTFTLLDIFPALLTWWAASFASLMAVCFLVRSRKARAIVTAVILGIGIGLYIQGNFMSGGYGQLNGEDIDWSGMWLQGVINTIVWIICIAVPVILSIRVKKKRKLQKMAAGLILAMQALACVLLVFTSDMTALPEDEDFTVSTEDAFTLSEDKNVVVFLLDNFSSVLFEEIITEDASYSQQFDGFTYFPDTVGAGCNTKGGLPFVLTGMWNENEYPFNDYLNKGYDNDLYAALEELDYDTRLFVEKKYVGTEAVGYLDNMVNTKVKINVSKVTSLMYKLTAFTYMPHFLKPAFWFYSGEFASASQPVDSIIKLTPDPEFYTSLNECGITTNSKYDGAYRFYYLSGAHAPYNMNENAEAVESGSVNMKQRAKGALKIVSTYLQQLRDKGLYDNTMVIVLADHGDWEAEVVINPMLLVKPFDSEVEGLAVSNAQITYEDLMPTQIEAITGNDAGTTVFEVNEDEERERRFLYYDWYGDWESDYLPELHEQLVTGNVRDSASRTPTGKVYTSEGVKMVTTYYEFGQVVEYNADTAGEQTYVSYGLYYPEATGTWTRGTYTNWKFPVESYNGGDLCFTVNLQGIKSGSQRTQLTVNGTFVEEFVVQGVTELKLIIPEELIDSNEINIRLDYPDAVTDGVDPRVLALAIKSVVLDYSE